MANLAKPATAPLTPTKPLTNRQQFAKPFKIAQPYQHCIVRMPVMPERCLFAPPHTHKDTHPPTLHVRTACARTSNLNHRRQQWQHVTQPQAPPDPVTTLPPAIAGLPSLCRRHLDFLHYSCEGTCRCSHGCQRARKMRAIRF